MTTWCHLERQTPRHAVALLGPRPSRPAPKQRCASSHRAPLVPQKLWGCRWRRPLPSSSSGRFVRVAAALVYPSFFSISVSNPLSSFVLSRLQPYPAPRRSPSFLVFDRPRAYIHERAVVFSEKFGGLRCVRGLVGPGLASEGSRLDHAVSSAAQRRAPVVLLAERGIRTYSQHVYPFFLFEFFPAQVSFLFGV